MLALRLAVLGTSLFLLVPVLDAQGSVNLLEREASPKSGVPCPSPDAYSLQRPDANGVPTVVAVGLFFQDIAQLSDVEQTLEADVYVVARWLDPRLSDPARGNQSAAPANRPGPECVNPSPSRAVDTRSHRHESMAPREPRSDIPSSASFGSVSMPALPPC